MNSFKTLLRETWKSDLLAIQAAAESFAADNPPRDLPVKLDLVGEGQRMMLHLEKWLLDDEQHQSLSGKPLNLYYLSAAALLCDIGWFSPNGLPDNNGRRRQDASFQETAKTLYQRSCDIILDLWREVGIPDRKQAQVIADICLRLHDAGQGGSPGSAPDLKVVDDAVVNRAFLSAGIKLAKQLDLAAAVTLCQIHGRLSPQQRIPLNRLKRYFDVIRTGPHPYLPATIQVKLKCRHPEIHRALKHHESAVQQTLDAANRSIRPRFLYANVVFEIEPVGYRPYDMKFTVDSSAALQLFAGNRLYADKRVFLRELIQNAVDACNIRKLSQPDYNPAISMTFNDDISVITIRDNGVGMDRQWLDKYFLAIGISFYQSDEIRDINNSDHIDVGFISQFGIGFLSSFLVADKIAIKTRQRTSEGLQITITSLRDYFDVRPLDDDFPVGTEVKLYLKKSKVRLGRSLEFVGYLKTNIRFLDVPVHLTDENGRNSIIGAEKMAYHQDRRYPETTFLAPLTFSKSEGYLMLRTLTNMSKIYALETASGGISIFQDGIFVTQGDTLLPEGARGHIVGRINLKGQDKCELSMDRNRIFWNGDQLRHLKITIRHGLVEVVNQLMAMADAQDLPEAARQSIVNHLSVFFDFSEFDDHMHQRLCSPIRQKVAKRFRDFVRINFAHTLRRNGIPEADGYSENWQQDILESFVRRT